MFLAFVYLNSQGGARPREPQVGAQFPSGGLSQKQFVQAEGLGSAPGGPVVIGDFNNDGKPDILYGGGETFQVLLNQGHHDFKALPLASAYGTVDSLVTGDFNGDGKL